MGAIPNGNIGVGSWFFSTGYAPLCANMASHWRTMERKKSQDGDPFAYEEIDPAAMFSITKNYFMQKMLMQLVTRYEWKNLPEGIDPLYLEYLLATSGSAVLFKDDALKDDVQARAPEGFAVMPINSKNDKMDIYFMPTEPMAYNPVEGKNYALDETNSVVILDNRLRIPLLSYVEMFAERMTMYQMTIDTNVKQQQVAKVFKFPEKQKLSGFKLIRQMFSGRIWAAAADSTDIGFMDTVDFTSPYIANEVMLTQNKYWNEWLTFIGIENTNDDKKERQITSEIMSNLGETMIQREICLASRKMAVESANAKWGLDIEVEFREVDYGVSADAGADQVEPPIENAPKHVEQ